MLAEFKSLIKKLGRAISWRVRDLIYRRIDDRLVICELQHPPMARKADGTILEVREALARGYLDDLGANILKEFSLRQATASGFVAVVGGLYAGHVWVTTHCRKQEGEPPFLYDISPGPHEAYIFDLYVDPDKRSQGLGRSLLEACLVRSWDLGCTGVFLTHDRLNPPMSSLVESLGFRPVGELSYRRVLGWSRQNTKALSQALSVPGVEFSCR